MLEKKANQKRDCRAPRGLAMTLRQGSALIMTVVLTVLLAIVAVMFVMVSRMDSASTSNIVDSKTLDNAAKSIIEIIGKELIFDTPGVAGQEYQDYPDVNDAWLANIEPYDAGVTYYKWRQISDVTGYLKSRNFQTQDISVDPPGTLKTIKDDTKIDVAGDGQLDDTGNQANADADGDGIADSKWIELSGLNSSKGKKVYAAIRVIDNCAMINVNTAYKFDANSQDRFRVDGTSQLQVNLNGLLKGGDKIDAFHKARGGNDAADDSTGWNNYNNQVIWKYDSVPSSSYSYLPFDISDELELRYRYCIDSKFVSRIETDANTTRGAGDPDFGKLYDTSTTNGGDLCASNWRLIDWQRRITDTNDCKSDRRHLLTTYSFDRLIGPDGNPMFNVRSGGNAQALYNRLVGGTGMDGAGVIEQTRGNVSLQDLNYYLAQIAANIVDYGDIDNEVSIVEDVGHMGKFYGYEPPFMFISEVARNFVQDACGVVHRSYAIELYKNFDNNDIFINNWRLTVGSESPILLKSMDFNDQGGQYYVLIYNDPCASMTNMVDFTDSPQNGAANVGRNITLRWPVYRISDPCDGNSYNADSYKLYISPTESTVIARTATATSLGTTFYTPPGLDPVSFPDGTPLYWCVDGYRTVGGKTLKKAGDVWKFTVGNPQPVLASAINSLGEVTLEREVGAKWIRIDMIDEPNFEDTNSLNVKSRQRDMRWERYLKANWSDVLSSATLGRWNDYDSLDNKYIQPWHNRFTTAGDAAMVFRKSTYFEGGKTASGHIFGIDSTADEDAEVRFDVNCPSMQNIFKYITALNPHDHASNDANETRVRGRININTAPAFVIAQLPWVSKVNRHYLKIADAIVAYRDKLDISPAGPDYYHGGATDARQTETGLPLSKYVVRTEPGFSSIGELMNVINKDNKIEYDIRYCGIDSGPDNGQQYGYPDLTFDSMSMTDTVANDLEEKELIFARISDLATVRSDTFTAYILVRVGVDGPQKRFIAILDRTGVTKPTDKVKVAAFQQVPAAR